MIQVGCFVSPHGFGHATRTSAVLEALGKRLDITAHIFSTIGEGIFAQTISNYTYHHQLTDIGFIQDDAFHLDMEATCAELESLLPYREDLVDDLAEICRKCSFLLCDISGLGIKVGKRAGIPSVLIENFTWDWLYDFYTRSHPGLGFFTDYLAQTFRMADFHIQTEPLCAPAAADLHCGPIFRKTRGNQEKLRQELGGGSRTMVLITLGGIGHTPDFLNELQEYDSFFFVFGGQQREHRQGKNVLLLDRSAKYYHPDLIGCADIVVFKSGYSTLAECYQCGTPSLCIQRNFAESEALERFAEKEMGSTIISQNEFLSGKWPAILTREVLRGKAAVRNGADEVAEFLLSRLRL